MDNAPGLVKLSVLLLCNLESVSCFPYQLENLQNSPERGKKLFPAGNIRNEALVLRLASDL